MPLRLPRMRYSLRVLFVAITLAAVGLYWLMLPTLNAQRYVEAINARHFDLADQLCAGTSGPFPGRWVDNEVFEPHAWLRAFEWPELWQGERKIGIQIISGDNDGIVTSGIECRATRRGIEPGMMFP